LSPFGRALRIVTDDDGISLGVGVDVEVDDAEDGGCGGIESCSAATPPPFLDLF